MAGLQKGVDKAFMDYYKSLDEGEGCIIQPLGSDRYRRLYWRFPLSRSIYVQSTPQTEATFPLLDVPEVLKRQLVRPVDFLQDEDDEPKAKDTPQKKEEPQKIWGEIPVEYLPDFIETLEPRGEREAALLKRLKHLSPYLETVEEPQDTRVTRARAHMFGYVNILKTYF
ncbi:hypothetical protein AGDE_15062 [Angomonas deanei]|nr:hypothetical protein AGDE_15062 [Angomonas deanei]|eukprot:EPY19747.1 hypothetical protein AGDE_15062 [Angomonas deanei]